MRRTVPRWAASSSSTPSPPTTQYASSVTAQADGGFVVTWQSDGQDGSGYGIYGQRYMADGTAEGSEFLVNTYTTNHQLWSSATALVDGGFVVAWTSLRQDGSDYGIYGQRYGRRHPGGQRVPRQHVRHRLPGPSLRGGACRRRLRGDVVVE